MSVGQLRVFALEHWLSIIERVGDRELDPGFKSEPDPLEAMAIEIVNEIFPVDTHAGGIRRASERYGVNAG